MNIWLLLRNGRISISGNPSSVSSRLNSFFAEEDYYPLLSDIEVADGNMPLTTLKAGSAEDGVRSFTDFHACAASAMVKMYISLVLSVE